MAGISYAWQQVKSTNRPHSQRTPFGAHATKRDSKGKAHEVTITTLFHTKAKLYLVGEWNDWGQTKTSADIFIPEKNGVVHVVTTSKLSHTDEYKILAVSNTAQQLLNDPATYYFADNGNSIFWDFGDPSTHKLAHKSIETQNRPTKILQTDLPGLITNWTDEYGILGSSIPQTETYAFIRTSGVINKVKELGFNSIQFLPCAQSIDGDNWKFRYLIPFPFAIQKNWGTPDDFLKMIDAFHAADIVVIADAVIGHTPHKDFKIFNQSSDQYGLHTWKKEGGEPYYLQESTDWGTMRPDFDNPYVREFYIASCLHFVDIYQVDGLRIDNVDGIIRHGKDGDGPERLSGRRFLRELTQSIYDINPSCLIHYEAHYYHNDNARLLTAPLSDSPQALGATAYNSSRLTHWFHAEYMLKGADEINLWRIKHINEEKEWSKSNSTVGDFHNHDAAAGLMGGRATGAYAYETMTLNQGNHDHAIGKIQVMEAFISFCLEGRTLDLLQTFLLQPGSFEHDSSIDWQLLNNKKSSDLVGFKQSVNRLLDQPAFWPENVEQRKFLNIDTDNSILVIERSDGKNTYICAVNTSSKKHTDYCLSVSSSSIHTTVLDSKLSLQQTHTPQSSAKFELLDQEIFIPEILPYHVFVLKVQ